MCSKLGVSIKWLSVSCFEIRCDDVTVVNDPFVTDCDSTELTWEAIESCDILCLSHAHFDHIMNIPKLVEKFRPLLLCGDQTAMPLASWLNYSPTRIYPMTPNLELDFDKVKIRALFGRHSEQSAGFNDLRATLSKYRWCADDQQVNSMQGIGSMEYRNYLLTFPSGVKILLYGSDVTPEQINICKELKPDIAILQRSFSPAAIQKKAAFAAAIGCKVLIPHHMDYPVDTSPEQIAAHGEAFLKLVPDGMFINPQHGQWIDL